MHEAMELCASPNPPDCMARCLLDLSSPHMVSSCGLLHHHFIYSSFFLISKVLKNNFLDVG